MNFFQQTNENLLEIREKNIPAYQVFMLAFQHMFAMFGATILVPLLTGLDPAVALFTSGLGTIVFHILKTAKCLLPGVLICLHCTTGQHNIKREWTDSTGKYSSGYGRCSCGGFSVCHNGYFNKNYRPRIFPQIATTGSHWSGNYNHRSWLIRRH